MRWKEPDIIYVDRSGQGVPANHRAYNVAATPNVSEGAFEIQELGHTARCKISRLELHKSRRRLLGTLRAIVSLTHA